MDLRFLDFLDAAGVAALVPVHQIPAKADREMTLRFHPSSRSRQVLRMVKAAKDLLRSD